MAVGVKQFSREMVKGQVRDEMAKRDPALASKLDMREGRSPP